MQKEETIFPLFIDTDSSYSEIKNNKSPFIRGLSWGITTNPNSSIGTNNPIGYGQNELVLSPTQSNIPIPTTLPSGYNKNIGAYYSDTTQETFYFNFNGNLQHGIYVLEGNSGLWETVVVDSYLLFTDDQKNFIANHRVTLRYVQDANGHIIEKFLIITDGGSWQKYINVIAAIKTNGFNAVQFPYWTLKQPHFDRRELLEYAVRPCLQKPTVTILPNTAADLGKINRFLDTGYQIAIMYKNTDGRTATLGDYSLPILIKSQDYLNNPDDIPKNISVNMQAGSPLTEQIFLYIRTSKQGANTIPAIENWSDWYLYDTIKKFSNSNSSDVLGTDYWLRTNPFAGLNYDTVFNTIDYILDLSKVTKIVDQEFANMIETGLPQLSYAMTDVGDSLILCDNRHGYPNFDDGVISEFGVNVIEKPNSSCPIQLREIR